MFAVRLSVFARGWSDRKLARLRSARTGRCVLSARCEEELVTSTFWDSLQKRARSRRRGPVDDLFLAPLIDTLDQK